jgi:hypothetical protein
MSQERLNEIRARLERLRTPHRLKIDVSGSVDISGISGIHAGLPADLEFLLAELTNERNRADGLRDAASSALCLLVEGPEAVGTRQAVEDARKVLSEALQATKHPQGTYRLTSIQRTLLERRGWQGQDPVAWLLRENA